MKKTDQEELARILGLKQRSDADVKALTQRLAKSPHVKLRQEQANALQALKDTGGLFAPMRVGSGKTLVTLLAPTLMQSQRPVLIVPASLREKTKREFKTYFKDWHVRLPEIISYEALGRVQYEHKLQELKPDLIILDEAHRARNFTAACTRRIHRYITQEAPVVLALSGTLMTTSLMDYHHLSLWTLGDKSPMPMPRGMAERWSYELDDSVPFFNQTQAPVDLSSIPNGFHEHFRTRDGVVPTQGIDCPAGITIEPWVTDLPDALRDVIKDVELTNMRPDGEMLDEYDLPDCLCQLAMGFYYRWDPEPPEWWLVPRRAYNAYVRAVLDEHIDGFDSPLMVVNALDNPAAVIQPPEADRGRALLKVWRSVQDKFEPNTVPVWLTDEVLRRVATKTQPGTLIWIKHQAAGHMLEQLGVPYYGAGTHPEDAKPGSTIALSIPAHSTGKNLQAWSSNLVLHPPANADLWEQLIGRTHRAGQKADEVDVKYLSVVDYHTRVMKRVRNEARKLSEASGFPYKLEMATWIDSGKK